MKNCKICGKTKTIDKYEKYRHQCKSCRNIKRKTFGTRSGVGLRVYRLKHQYNLSLDNYNEMLKTQNGVCAICKGNDNGPWGTLSVDHCHSTGNVRGLLCAKCNKGLGQFNDDTKLFNLAIEYIEKHKYAK